MTSLTSSALQISVADLVAGGLAPPEASLSFIVV